MEKSGSFIAIEEPIKMYIGVDPFSLKKMGEPHHGGDYRPEEEYDMTRYLASGFIKDRTTFPPRAKSLQFDEVVSEAWRELGERHTSLRFPHRWAEEVRYCARLTEIPAAVSWFKPHIEDGIVSMDLEYDVDDKEKITFVQFSNAGQTLPPNIHGAPG